MKAITEKAKENIIVVSHRGACGGNIPCNTMAAYEIALKQGADMIEADVSVSGDGKLYLFHPMMERAHFGKPLYFGALPLSVIKKQHYVNYDRTKTQFTVEDFDTFLEVFKDRCYINIDKFWSAPEKIYRAIQRHGMTQQCLVKSKPSEKVFRLLENLAPDLPFIPIVSEKHDCHEELMGRRINYIGAEVLFKEDTSCLASDEFIDKMHSDGKLLWANAIIYDYRKQIAGGHSDDTALTVSEDYGWGWLADKGFDFIQTDWTMMLVDYLKRTDRYFKGENNEK
ncbi:MAG: glycerophosphodiester phosphodiesterase family protein [Clostridia bacterium]|nr:glycerophosphodiester phosphodiesterase family protein [Clostridia bacterium]